MHSPEEIILALVQGTPLVGNPNVVRVAASFFIDMAYKGMDYCHREQYDFCVFAHQRRKETKDLAGCWPKKKRPAESGPFASLTVEEIFTTAFTLDAFEYVLDHAYNGYVLWKNVATVFERCRSQEVELPFTLTQVQSAIESKSPIGAFGSSHFKFHMTLLRVAAQANDGRLDPNKLDAAYAFELMRNGLIFRQDAGATKDSEIAPLVINPLWQHLVADDLLSQPIRYTL